MFKSIARLLSVLAFATLSFTAVAHDHSNIKFGNMVIRAVAEGTKATGGFLTITNNGEHADRLISVSADFAGKSEIHEMKMEEGVMKMRELADGIEVPAGETVTLKRGGNHLMFMKLPAPVEKGSELEVLLTFEKAGEVTVTMKVVDDAMLADMFKDAGDGHDHSHDHEDKHGDDHGHKHD